MTDLQASGLTFELSPASRSGSIRAGLRAVVALSLTDITKLRRGWIELVTRALQPVLWLAIFGTAITSILPIEVDGLPYLDFITPGIVAQSGMFVAMFYGVALIWERDVGLTDQLMVTPTPRWGLTFGKAVSAAARGLIQMVSTCLIAVAVGVNLEVGVVNLLLAGVAVALGCIVFANISILCAAFMRGRDQFLGMGQLLTVPTFFASNALYPLEALPTWLRGMAYINPLTYEVDILRQSLVGGSPEAARVGVSLGILTLLAVGTTAAATRGYRRLVS